MLDYQVSIAGLTMGPGTNYIIHEVDGFGAPEIRATDVDRPRDHGQFMALDFLGGRTVTIKLTVRGATPSAVVSNLDALMAVWRPNTPDASSVTPLTWQFPGQAPRTFLGRPRRASPDTSRIIGNRIPVVLEYRTPDPRQYAAAASSGSVGINQVASGRSYPRVYPLSYGASISDFLVAINAGTMPTRPTARIVGPVTNPKIQSDTAGAFLKFLIALGVGDFLDVNFDAKTVLLNGTASRYSTLTTDSSWWELAPGTNQIRFFADAFQTSAALTLTWASAWI